MTRPSAHLWMLPLALAALVLTGCTGSDGATTGGPSPSSTTTTSPSVTPEAAKPVPPRAPACHRLNLRDAARPTSTADPVPCSTAHTTLTFHVGRLVPPGHKVPDVTSRTVNSRLTRTCNRELADFVGGEPGSLLLSRLQAVWFRPTTAEIDAGARWVRCDLLAFARGDQLMLLPHLRMDGVLDRPVGPEVFGLCGTAAPGTNGFERVACRLRHSWVAISTIPISGGVHYPGVQHVREAGDSSCSDQVNSRTSALKFDYGWEWPTRAQWVAGQHYGYCWAPASLT